MTIQTGVSVDVAYKAEAGFGVAPGAVGAKLVRRIGSTLTMGRQALRSNEIRSDAQIAGQRHGSRRVQGELRGELSLGAWDDFLAAAVRGAWAAGAGFTGQAAASAEGRSFTRAAGSWIGDGFKCGDVVRWSGLAAGNDGRDLRVVGLTDAVMTVAESVVDASAAATCAVAGGKAAVGTLAPSFTVEHQFTAAGFSQLFTGCRIGRMDLSLSPNRLAEIGFALVGKDMAVLEGADAPHFDAPAAPPVRHPLAAVDATLRLGGDDIGVVTGLDLTVDLGLAGDAVLGGDTVPELFYGRTSVSGTLTTFVEDAALLKNFTDGVEPALHVLLAPRGGSGFLALHLPRLFFTGGDIRLQGGEGLPIRLPFQALLKPDGGAGTAWDAATVVLQTEA